MPEPINSKTLREKRGPIAKQIKDMAELAQAEGRTFNAEEDEKWLKLGEEYDSLSKQINIAERAERVAADQVAPIGEQRIGRENFDGEKARKEEERKDTPAGPSSEHRALALQAWCRVQAGKDLEDRHKEACRICGVNPNRNEYELQLTRQVPKTAAEARALSVSSGSLGGYTVPEGFMSNLEVALLQFGGMRQVSDVMRTASGNPMPWPTANDTSNKGRLIAENTEISTTDVTFGQIIWNAYKYSSDFIKVPVELLEDSAFDLASLLGSMCGERIGRITNEHFTTGSGAAMPKGIVTAATLGKTTASATAITADEILDLIHSVDPSYRTGAGFMMHDGILLAVRKLKDSANNYIYTPLGFQGMSQGFDAAPRLFGFPITVNQDMDATVASTKKTILFGQLMKYKIRDVASIRLRRLEERFADFDQVAFVMLSRHDGNLLDAGTRPVKFLQQLA